jgi:dsDNA-binding SOS-regulon protein
MDFTEEEIGLIACFMAETRQELFSDIVESFHYVEDRSMADLLFSLMERLKYIPEAEYREALALAKAETEEDGTRAMTLCELTAYLEKAPDLQMTNIVPGLEEA